MNHKFTYKIIIVSIIFVIFALFIYGIFKYVFSVKEKEVLRVTSPDSKVDAVVTIRDAGATLDTGYFIYIVLHNKKLSSNEHPIFVADHTNSLKVDWIGVKRLSIQYKKTRIFQFTNFWQSPELENYKYIVEIELFPLIDATGDSG